MFETTEAPHTSQVIVPIRSLGPSHRDRIAAHLVALDADDRYLRFGYPATDEQIGRYVDWISTATTSSASTTASSN
jgi:hypothetical protein